MRAWLVASCLVVPGLAGARWEPEAPQRLVLQAAPWVMRGEPLALSLSGPVPPGSAHLLAADAAGVVHAPSPAFGGPMPDLAAPMRHVASSPFAGSAAWTMRVDGYAAGGQVAFQVIHAAGQGRILSNSVTVRVIERGGDEDGDGISNAEAVSRGLDPFGAAQAGLQVLVDPRGGGGALAPGVGPGLPAAPRGAAGAARGGADSADSGGGRR